ncbi:MAG: hypothetical protein EKK42_27040 [Pseudonocardiaceae bacterium]|nr:MAG: hypothetical protein EKK42_27040 [Pseudonocardiaceae bacterium]
MKTFALVFAICAVPIIASAQETGEKMPPTVTCAQFRDRFRGALIGNNEGIDLASLFTGENQEKFEISGIQAAIGCTARGMFEGFGASLLETNDASVRRYARFTAASVRAIQPELDHSASIRLMTNLSTDALEDARQSKSHTGQMRGEAETSIGPYVVMQSFVNGLARTHIELRYKD